MAEGLEGLLAGHTLVKRYKIEEVCGRGGFAVVYRATDTRLGRPVAVKVITLTANDPEHREVLRQRLHREARAAASLPHHPNLVTVHDVGTDPELGLDFLVMELLQGENLSQALQRGRPPLPRALRILRDAAEGLAIGHRAGLVHRDVKPGNIFLARTHGSDPEVFRVCLLDYGIALAIEDDQTLTRGMAALSPAFASPEQLAGSRDLSPATDVFSLGVVAYQLLTGERPFASEPGEAPAAWTVRSPIRALSPEVSPAVEAVVMRAMSVDPRARFPDADAFVDALDAATRGEDDLAARAHSPGVGALLADEELEEEDRTIFGPPPSSAAAASAAPRRPVPPLRAPVRHRSRKGSKLPVLIVAVLLLAAVGAWAMLLRDGGTGELEPAAANDSLGADVVRGAGDEGASEEEGLPPEKEKQAAVNQPAPAGSSTVRVPEPSSSASGAAGPREAPAAPSAPAEQPVARPQRQPAARPPTEQPDEPAAQEPEAPPAQRPQRPVQTPPEPPPTLEPSRPQPPLLGRPVEPRPNAPRDTLFIPTPGGARR